MKRAILSVLTTEEVGAAKKLQLKLADRIDTLQKRLTVVSGMERSGFPETHLFNNQFREIRFT